MFSMDRMNALGGSCSFIGAVAGSDQASSPTELGVHSQKSMTVLATRQTSNDQALAAEGESIQDWLERGLSTMHHMPEHPRTLRQVFLQYRWPHVKGGERRGREPPKEQLLKAFVPLEYLCIVRQSVRSNCHVEVEANFVMRDVQVREEVLRENRQIADLRYEPKFLLKLSGHGFRSGLAGLNTAAMQRPKIVTFRAMEEDRPAATDDCRCAQMKPVRGSVERNHERSNVRRKGPAEGRPP